MRPHLAPLALALTLTACAAAQRTGQREASFCATPVRVPAGFAAVEDAALRAQVLGNPGEGRLCSAALLEAREAVPVWRLYNRADAHSQLGRWWLLERPAEPVASLRERLAVCPEWSPLDALVECRLRVGARVALGPGQSVQCTGGRHFDASPALQLYVPNDTRSTPQVVLVEDCHERDAPPR